MNELPDDELEDEEELEEPEEPAEDAAEKELEARARRMGWRPEAEWDTAKGGPKPAKFKTPAEFIAETESKATVLRERNRFLDSQVAALNAGVAEMKAKQEESGKLIADLHRQNKEVGQRAYERGKSETEAAMRAAVEEGNVAAFDKAQEKLKQLEASKPAADPPAPRKVDPPRPTAPARPAIPPEIQPWVDANPWFLNDATLNVFAGEVHTRLIEENPGVPAHELLDDVRKEVVARFPERFGVNTRRTAPNSVSRPSAPGNRKGNGIAFKDLPREDRESFKRMQRIMEEKGDKYTEEEFVRDYHTFNPA